MKNSTARWQWAFLIIALVISAATLVLFSGRKGSTQSQAVVSEPDFGEANYNVMKKDSFISLTTRAYKGQAVFSQQEGKLLLDIKGADQPPKDFFNNNESLLKFNLGDHGFLIAYNAEGRTLHAEFKVDAQQGVTVPNDVLINLVRRTYNQGI